MLGAFAAIPKEPSFFLNGGTVFEFNGGTVFEFNGGTVFEPWMKKALELVDGYLGYLGAKLSSLPLVTSPYYSKHVACNLGAGQSPLGALCNITLQRFCERGLFSHDHSQRGMLRIVTRNPLYCVATWDVATRYKNDKAPYKELSQNGIPLS